MVSSRELVHLDADAFFASVEQASDRRLRGRPMAVGGEKRGIIACASYEARRYGVYTPMPTRRARKLCPQLIVVPGNYEKYEQFSQWMFSYAYDFTPDVEVASIDEGYFDLTSARGRPREIAETIRQAIRDCLKLSVSEGIGSNKLISQVASKLRKPGALVQVLPGQEKPFLHPLRNRWLPGIGPSTQRRLDTAGLTHVGQLAATSPELLAVLVGSWAPRLHAFANGRDDRPLERERPAAKSYSQQRTFDEDITDERYVEAVLRAMADELAATLREEGRAVRTLTVKVRYNDFAEDQAGDSLDEPTDLETDLYPRLRPLLRKAWRRRVSLRLVSLRLSRVYDALFPTELALDRRAWNREARRKLALALDELRREHGHPLVMRGHHLVLTQPPRSSCAAPPVPRAQAPAVKTARTPFRDFVPLHAHSYYSFLDALLSPRRLAETAADRGVGAIALTDTGNLHGLVPFMEAARAAGIRPIAGAEIRVDGLPVLLYPRQAEGYRHLSRLLTQGHHFRASRFDLPTEGLLAVVSHPRLATLFRDRVYLGVRSSRQAERAAGGLPVVAVPGIHFAEPGERRRLGVLQSVRTRTLLDHAHPEKREGSASPFPTKEAMATFFRDHPDVLRNTFALAEEAAYLPETGRLQFPRFDPPDGGSPGAFLRALVEEGLRRRYGSGAADLGAQVREELNMIHEVGYEEYFLVVWDLLQRCRDARIPWLTRGSAADSLVCYCLGISSICPVRFNLYFRRFLNRERMLMNKLPDIDVDFPHDRKDDVVDLVLQRYGPDHAAVVGGFSTYQARSAFADVAKVLGVSEHQVRRVTEHIPRSRARDLPYVVRACAECRDLPLGEEPYRTALEMAEVLDGFPRYPKMHPCGVVLSRDPMLDLTPCFRSPKGYPTTHFDMDAVEAVGLVKLDLLAQGGLATLRDVTEGLAARGHPQDLEALEPWEDEAVWELVSSGQARAVHHIESPAMVSLCRMCNVRDIDTLVAIVSVIRPGAANEQKKLAFTRRYQGTEAPVFVHPSVEPCLRETYGLIVYEEQVLQVAEAFAGMPPGDADRLRRSLVKQDRDAVKALGVVFARCAATRGRTPEEIRETWKFVCAFNGYAFCKAHSAAYAVEAYQAAWLKLHHPAEFLAAVLTHGKGFYAPLVYVLEAHRLGIALRPPCVNNPGPGFSVRGGRIRVPVRAVKGLSEGLLARLDEARRLRAFTGLADFAVRVQPGDDEMDHLLRAGALDAFGPSRAGLWWAWKGLRARGDAVGHRQRLLGELFPTRTPEVNLTEPSLADRLRDEMTLLGFTASDHPLALYPDIDWDSYCPVQDLPRHAGETVTCCGLVVEDRITQQRSGEPMKFMTLADWTGLIETELFASTYRKYALPTIRYPVLEVTATVERFENGRGHTLRVHRAGAPRRKSSQRSEVRCQKSDVRSQMSEVSGQESAVRSDT